MSEAIQTLGSLVTLVLLVFLINVVLRSSLLKLHRRYEEQGDLWKDCLISALITPLVAFVWLFAGVQILNYVWRGLSNLACPIPPHLAIVTGAILAIAWFLLRWKKMVVHRLLERSKAGMIQLDHGKVDVVNKILTILIYLITGFLLLEQFGSSINTLIAFGGISGLAIAFASQQIIANFFGGVIIYFTKPFVVGEWIEIPEKEIEGQVEEIGWYTTRVQSFSKRPIYIPNSLLTNILVINTSRMTHRQFKHTISLRYADLDKLHPLISDLRHFFQSHKKIDQHLPPQIHLGAFGSNGVEIVVSAYTSVVEKNGYNSLAEELLFGIAAIVNKHGADFAIPSYALEFPKGIPLKNS